VFINKLIATFFLLFSCAIEAGTLQGKVVGVADGDSLTVLDEHKTQHKIRLQGIDAPEKASVWPKVKTVFVPTCSQQASHRRVSEKRQIWQNGGQGNHQWH
jgi:endonuclease YncB( thermonuclease family)